MTDEHGAVPPAVAPRLDLGGVTVTAVDAGRLRLDGGAMFGVVPRPLWERQRPADARHRVDNACRCLLVRSGDAVVLVDTGCGQRFDASARDMFAVDPAVNLVAGLAAAGATPTQVTHVLFTHLHFDHAAGALHSAEGADGADGANAEDAEPLFPQALHLVHRGEWEDACANRSIMRSSYHPTDLMRLADRVPLRFLSGDGEVAPGVSVEATGGHTRHHQAVLVTGTGATLLFPGDVLPTRAHLRPYWVMAYDMDPYRTLTCKQELARRAAAADWIVAWDHDPDTPFSRLRDDGDGGWRAQPVDSHPIDETPSGAASGVPGP